MVRMKAYFTKQGLTSPLQASLEIRKKGSHGRLPYGLHIRDRCPAGLCLGPLFQYYLILKKEPDEKRGISGLRKPFPGSEDAAGPLLRHPVETGRTEAELQGFQGIEVLSILKSVSESSREGSG